MARKSFVMYESWAAMITALPDNQALQIMRAICAFQTGSNYVIDDPVVKAYFESTVLPEMEENARKYQAKVENANISAEKRIANTKSESQIQKANRSESKASRSESQANKSEGVYVYVNDNDNDNEYVDVDVNDDVNDSDTEKPKTEKKSAEKKPHCEDPDLNRALNDFIESRKVNKKPMTERAITLLLNRLESLAPGDNKRKIELLNEAVLHGWQSVYVSRDDQPKARQPNGYVDAINNRMDSLKQWAEENGINPNDVDGQGGMF